MSERSTTKKIEAIEVKTVEEKANMGI